MSQLRERGYLIGLDRTTQEIRDEVDLLVESARQYRARNRIINGNFLSGLWQEGQSFNQIADGQHFADMWEWASPSSGEIDVSATSSVPSGASGLSGRFVVDTADASIAAGDLYYFRQPVEGYMIQDLGFGQSGTRYVTLSFWAWSSVPGIYCASLRNNDGSRSYVAEFTINAAATWEYKALTIPVDTTGTWQQTTGNGVWVSFAFAVGSTFQTTAGAWAAGNFLGSSNQVNFMADVSNDFRIKNVQLEAGEVATAFEHRPFQVEQALVSRYFERLAFPVLDEMIAVGYASTTSQGISGLYYRPKRSTPAFTPSSGSHFRIRSAAGLTQSSSASVDSIQSGNPRSKARLLVNLGTSPLTAGGGLHVVSGSTSLAIDIDARL